MMKQKLKNIANIRLGYAFRGRIIPDATGDIYVIQPKDLSDFNPITISIDKINVSHLLTKQDVLFSNRGNFRAKTFDGTKKAIASGGFFVLRVNNSKFLPEYVELFLNSSLGQQVFASKQELMTIPALTKRQVEEIKIPVIQINKQRQLVKLAQLHQKEYALMQQLIELKQQRLNQI